MKKNIVLITLLLLGILLVIQGCTTTGSDTITPTATETPVVTEQLTTDTSELVLTPEELAQYDGANGNPAYIAIDGVIYDVTNVPQWRNGQHNGFTAGQDLTEEIKNISPHGVSKLIGIPVVGKLAE